jgi:hypothetical protein
MVRHSGSGLSGTGKSAPRARRKSRRHAGLHQRRSSTDPLTSAGFTEPDLIMLLGEPEVRLVMRAVLA